MAALAPALAQVTVEVTQEQHQFLQGESLPVAVRITNRSGQTLHLGADEDWLTFSIEGQDGRIVSKISEVPVKGEFDLESSLVATKRADLVSSFAPMTPGHYAIVATIRIKEWNREISSPPAYFDIIEGAKLWEQEVGVPPSTTGAAAAPELRKYILQQANYLRGQIRLYLRITDSYGKTYRVFPVGRLVSFSRPEPQVDKFSHLHLLYQNGPSSFSYCVFDLDGTVLARQTYEYSGSRPVLRMDDDGTVFIVGGVRRISSKDVPPASPEDNLQPVQTNDVSKTNTPPTKKKSKR